MSVRFCHVLVQRLTRRIVKLHIQPTVVILSMRVDEAVEHYFDPNGRSRGSINGGGKDLGPHMVL